MIYVFNVSVGKRVEEWNLESIASSGKIYNSLENKCFKLILKCEIQEPISSIPINKKFNCSMT